MMSIAPPAARPVSCQVAARQRNSLASRVVCAARPVDSCAGSRRTALLGLASGSLLMLTQDSQAAIGVWDGEKGLGMCELGDDGEACRMKQIQKDGGGSKQDYSSVTSNTYSTVQGTPVAEMGDEYTKETFALANTISTFVQMDPYDKQRGSLYKQIKLDGSTWVSRYARGGNVRKQSARSVYVAVDSLQGHFAQNGLAPYPKGKTAKLLNDLETGCNFALEGK